MSATNTHQQFNVHAFDEQIVDWVRAGLNKEQIIEKAKVQWPSVEQAYVQDTLAITLKLMAEEKPRHPISPFRDACNGHIKRKKFLHKLEVKIEAMEEVPVSLLSLYRGVLRDFDASCYKLLALQRTQELDRRQRVKEQQQEGQKANGESIRQALDDYLAMGKQHAARFEANIDQDEEDDPATPQPHPLRNGVMASLLIVCTVALTFLSTRLLPRSPLLVVQSVEPVVERLQADPQLVGGSGLIPLMLVQHRKNMLHLDVLERTAIAADCAGNRSTATVRLHRNRA